MRTISVIFGLSILFLSPAGAEETAALPKVEFAAKPAVEKAGDAVKISFAASAPTDCEVAVLDGAGNVVRHLAAGLLGGKTPPPAPLEEGLAQSIEWDGKDDFGKLVDAAACTIRVRLGTSARLGKVLFSEPGIAFSPRAATVGPDGLVYVLEELGQAKTTFLLEAYTQEGKYVRTVMPYPADLPPERLAGLPRAKLPDGRWLPAVHQGAFRDLYPESTGMRPQRMPITSKGWILLVNSVRTHNAGARQAQRVLVVDPAGGTPRESYLGPLTSADKFPYGLCWLALSPDEKWIYTSGHLKDGSYDDGFKTPPQQVVCRVGWDDKEQPTPFIGELYKAGNDEAHLDAPRGIDTDAEGRIYVCDWGNDRVAVFDAGGKWVGKIDVEAPDQVAVERKSGAVYVLTATSGKKPEVSKLVKFPGIGKPTAAEVDVGFPYCTLSLNATDKGVDLWLARTFGESPQKKRGVEKVEDRDGKLSAPVEVIRHRGLPDVYQIGASPVSDDVFVHSYSEHLFARVDGASGEVKLLPSVKGHDLAVGPQGQVVTLSLTDYGKSLGDVQQYDREGQPLPFAGLGSNAIKGVPGSHWGHASTGSKGLCVAPNGDLVIVGPLEKAYGVWVYGPDGKAKPGPTVKGLSGADGSPQADLAGNLYVATAAKPADEVVPSVFDAKKPPTRFYPWIYGGVAKFPPAGGTLYYKNPDAKGAAWPPAGAEKMLKLVSNLRGTEAFADGALWCRGGFTVTPASNWSVSTCHCYTSRFGLDYYGRVFMPDVGRFGVQALDSAGNPLFFFGDYGNPDDAGAGGVGLGTREEAGSQVSGPAPRTSAPGTGRIPFAWPVAVSVGKNGVYVSDFINRRILRVDLVAAAEETAKVQ